MNKARRFGKSVIAAIVLGSISFFGFLLYMLLVGIPKTQARYYYNLAEESLEASKTSLDKSVAKHYLERAIEFWPENYIKEKLNSLN